MAGLKHPVTPDGRYFVVRGSSGGCPILIFLPQ